MTTVLLGFRDEKNKESDSLKVRMANPSGAVAGVRKSLMGREGPADVP